MISIIKSILLFVFPTFIARILTGSHHSISKSASIGFSWVRVDELIMSENSRIGNLNIIKGPMKVFIKRKGQIGNRNVVTRAGNGITWGESILEIGLNSKITAEHKIDLCRSVSIGDNSILAGLKTQIWTHGYAHLKNGNRYRVDGSVSIGSNVYIGSSCIINGGICISDNITTGSGSCVSKDLKDPGLYVSAPLRFIEKDNTHIPNNLIKVNSNLCEAVYVKK